MKSLPLLLLLYFAITAEGQVRDSRESSTDENRAINTTSIVIQKYKAVGFVRYSDFGAIGDGELIIRDCVFDPSKDSANRPTLIVGYNSGQHDFGYTCYMPERIRIENLYIDDSNFPNDSPAPVIFADFNSERIDDSYKQTLPYVLTKEVILKNVTTASGKDLKISSNPFMFKDVMMHSN